MVKDSSVSFLGCSFQTEVGTVPLLAAVHFLSVFAALVVSVLKYSLPHSILLVLLLTLILFKCILAQAYCPWQSQ